MNAFRVIERLERMDILDGQNTESVKEEEENIYWLPNRKNLHEAEIEFGNEVLCKICLDEEFVIKVKIYLAIR